MLKALGLRRSAAPHQKAQHSSDASKYTVDTTSIGDDSSSSDGSHQADDYGLPSVYTTPGFHHVPEPSHYQQQHHKLVSVPTLVRNTSTVLSNLREREHHHTSGRAGSNRDIKWWNFDANLTSVDEVQEEIIFETDDEDDGDDPFMTPSGDSDCLPSSPDTFNFMMDLPFSPRGSTHGKQSKHMMLHIGAGLEEVEEEICFSPRFEKEDDFPERSAERCQSYTRQVDHQMLGASPMSQRTDTDFMLPVERSFRHLTFMTPQDFDALENAPARRPQNQADEMETTRPLSTMVHSMEPKHFAKSPSRATAATASCSSFASFKTNVSSTSTEASSVLNVDRYKIIKKKTRLDALRKRLSSAFRSSSGKKSVSYSLSTGKTGMSKQEQVYAASLLPSKPLLSKSERRVTSSMVPRPMLRHDFDQPLSILLLNPVLKIFEIVLVDFFRETTVGDALSKARAASNDESLSSQKYVSLCNRTQELAAPMLPVSLLVDTADPKQDRPLSFAEKRKLMEKRLLVAVPDGSSAKDCQHIRRVLWRNPKVQRWWKRSNPFCHPDESEVDEDEDENLFDPSSLVSDQEVDTKPAPQPMRRQRQPKVRYQRLDDDDELMI